MDGTPTAVEVEQPRPKVGPGRVPLRDRTVPPWWFHLVLLVATLPLLWSISSPTGGILNWTVLSLGVLFVGALVWVAWLIDWTGGRRWDGPRPSGIRFIIAPLCACVFGALVFVNAPLWARWNHAQPSFERIADGAPPARTDGRPLEFDVPASAGTYHLDHAVRIDDDVFIYLAPRTGGSTGFLVDAGFAYLPDGPDPTQPDPLTGAHRSRTRLATNGDETVIEHVTGDWYTWASYW